MHLCSFFKLFIGYYFQAYQILDNGFEQQFWPDPEPAHTNAIGETLAEGLIKLIKDYPIEKLHLIGKYVLFVNKPFLCHQREFDRPDK